MPPLDLRSVRKSFTMHLMGGIRLPVVAGVTFKVAAGECAALTGPSGAGKSSIMRMIYGNYRCDEGAILVADGDNVVDMANAEPRRILQLRRRGMGYVSQFLRVIPRVSALHVVAEPLVAQGVEPDAAQKRAGNMLSRLNIPTDLWPLPPTTFSGGEQQRVNLARGFIADHPLLLLDEPTASLDADNSAIAIDLIAEKKQAGTAILGIFHDAAIRAAVSDREIDVTRFKEVA